MQFETNHIYHIFNRGNNSQKIFFNRNNYFFFLKKIQIHIIPYADIMAWCLMPNHFHLMIYVDKIELDLTKNSIKNSIEYVNTEVTSSKECRSINQSFAIMLRSYTRAINRQEKRKGSLFQMNTKALCLTDNSSISPAWFNTNAGTLINISDPMKSYPQVCFNYIHDNPVTAKLVSNAIDWEFSSYRDYFGERNGRLINKERCKEFGFFDFD